MLIIYQLKVFIIIIRLFSMLGFKQFSSSSSNSIKNVIFSVRITACHQNT
jgi:hypothetical protein